ncbi:MAG: SRPBCC family protein [Marinoscillum sp.]
MPKFHVEKSILIEAPVAKVYECISNLHHWNQWSPWLVLEPDAKFTVAEDGDSYAWEGDRVGSGEMKILNRTENQSVDYDLHFLKPWKSQADIRFELEEVDGKTKVTWLMDSKLPFFMFFMRKMMVAFLGMDFDRGLNMLQDLAEDGKVHSSLEFIGETNYPGCQYVGLKTSCPISTIGETMSGDFEKMMGYMGDKTDLINSEPVTIYHKWELTKDRVEYTVAIPVSEVPTDLPSGFFQGSIPETKIYKLRHKGPYKHLGNPWSAIMNLERAKVFKHKKGIHPFESYVNSPVDTDEKQLITDVNFAVK